MIPDKQKGVFYVLFVAKRSIFFVKRRNGSIFADQNDTINQIIINSMKKIVTILAASMMLFGVNAIAQPSIGAGYLSSTETFKSGNSSSTDKTPMNGFYVGLSYTLPIVGGLNFTPGVYYGYATRDNVVDAIITKINAGKRKDMYINVPLHFSYGLDLTDALRLFVYGGPSASIGVSSKTVSGNTTIDRYGENSNLQRFDIMLGAGAGLEFNEMIRFQVGYDWGMLNRYNTNNYSVHRNQLTAGVAFLFYLNLFKLTGRPHPLRPAFFVPRTCVSLPCLCFPESKKISTSARRSWSDLTCSRRWGRRA